MFWESVACDLQFSSILDDEDVDKITLEELIDKLPNLVNEYDVGNEKLIQILKRRDILESLIRNVTETPAENLNENERFKYANQSCVLFSSKSNQMENELIQQQDLLDKLLDFLQTDDELNPLMASFFANALFSIYTKFTEPMINYFNSKTDFFDLLFKHIHISAIMDFLLKLTTLDSLNNVQISSDVYRWLNTQNIIKRMVDVFRTNDNQNALENVSSLLSFLIQKGRQALIKEEGEIKFYQFYNESFLADLVDICFTHKISAIHILRVLIQFIDYENHLKIIDGIKSKFNPVHNLSQEPAVLSETFKISNQINSIKSAVSTVSYEYLASIKNLHKVAQSNLDKFKNLLLESVPDYSVKTTTGLVEKPLGFLRLEIIHFFYALLLANNPEMDEAFAKNNILQILIDLFFEYEFNSFLHNHVNNIVTTIFLNANLNRFKLMNSEQAKSEFLTLDTADKWKDKNLSLMQVVNLIWSDNECYQFVKKLTDISIETTNVERQESIDSPSQQSPSSNKQLIDNDLEYTLLIAQLFNECNLVERIMIKYKSIMDEKDPRKAIPTHKSNLIDIADVINCYLQNYEKSNGNLPEQLMQTNFATLKEEWQKLSINELALVRNKISNVEESIKNQQNVEQDFRKFIYQSIIKPLEFESPYSAKDFEFSMHMFETQFEREMRDKPNPEMSNLSSLVDPSADFNDKKFEIDLFKRRFDDEDDLIEEELDKKKETKSISEDVEQFSSISEQLSNLTDKDNIFQPLASSSNISNELNIEMDIEDSDIMKYDDNAFEANLSAEKRLPTGDDKCTHIFGSQHDKGGLKVISVENTIEQLNKLKGFAESTSGDESIINQENEATKCEQQETKKAETEKDDWVDFEKERANK